MATHAPLTGEQVAALRRLHDEIPTREGHWPRHGGSYAVRGAASTITSAGWRFHDHGHRTLEWSDHCNRGYTRWILREHGITLTGPEPRTLMPPVPPELLRREAATALPTLMADLTTWIDIDAVAWGQRYAVVTVCRLLYTLMTAEVASKAGAAGEWAMSTLDPTWRPLLGAGP